MSTGAWIAFAIITLILVFATVVCLKSFYNPHFGEKLLESMGDSIRGCKASRYIIEKSEI
jgi:hypothetical protein